MKAEVIGVILGPDPPVSWFLDTGREAVFLGKRHGFFLAVELEMDLVPHIGGPDPSHQGIGQFWRARLELEDPAICVALTGLHGGLGRLINANIGHRVAPWDSEINQSRPK